MSSSRRDDSPHSPGTAIPGSTAPSALETPNATFDASEELTGLPLLSTWPRLYVFVLIAFILTVLALVVLTRSYS